MVVEIHLKSSRFEWTLSYEIVSDVCVYSLQIEIKCEEPNQWMILTFKFFYINAPFSIAIRIPPRIVSNPSYASYRDTLKSTVRYWSSYQLPNETTINPFPISKYCDFVQFLFEKTHFLMNVGLIYIIMQLWIFWVCFYMLLW